MDNFSLLLDDSLSELVSKFEAGTVSDHDVDLFVVKQQERIVRAGRIALIESLALQEKVDGNVERFLATSDPEELRPIFEPRNVRE